MVEYTGTITDSVGEYFDYDTCSTLVDTSRNGILNMMLSDSAENTAQTIEQCDANRHRADQISKGRGSTLPLLKIEREGYFGKIRKNKKVMRYFDTCSIDLSCFGYYL